MPSDAWKAAAVGAAQGAVGAAALFLADGRRSLANDWFLVLAVVGANASGMAVAARCGVNLLGVALAGLVGAWAGGWAGSRTIGSYEYTVPAPVEDRTLRIVSQGQERVIPIAGAPATQVRRVPVGGGLGVLAGLAAGAGLYGWLRRPRWEPDGPDAAPPGRGDPDGHEPGRRPARR